MSFRRLSPSLHCGYSEADQLATMVSSDVDQLRQALTRHGNVVSKFLYSCLATWRFLEISPDFRKASLSIGMEPQEQPHAEMAACCT